MLAGSLLAYSSFLEASRPAAAWSTGSRRATGGR